MNICQEVYVHNKKNTNSGVLYGVLEGRFEQSVLCPSCGVKVPRRRSR